MPRQKVIRQRPYDMLCLILLFLDLDRLNPPRISARHRQVSVSDATVIDERPSLDPVFCAVAVAPYRTPGTPEMGKLVADLVDKHNTILMANHGVVAWSHLNVEEAYWRMEIIEAYCRTVVVASQLGKPLHGFSPSQLKDLLNIKENLGFVDPRFGLKECELCDNNDWRPGVQCAVPAQGNGQSDTAMPDADAEKMVQVVTDLIMERISQ